MLNPSRKEKGSDDSDDEDDHFQVIVMVLLTRMTTFSLVLLLVISFCIEAAHTLIICHNEINENSPTSGMNTFQ